MPSKDLSSEYYSKLYKEQWQTSTERPFDFMKMNQLRERIEDGNQSEINVDAEKMLNEMKKMLEAKYTSISCIPFTQSQSTLGEQHSARTLYSSSNLYSNYSNCSELIPKQCSTTQHTITQEESIIKKESVAELFRRTFPLATGIGYGGSENRLPVGVASHASIYGVSIVVKNYMCMQRTVHKRFNRKARINLKLLKRAIANGDEYERKLPCQGHMMRFNGGPITCCPCFARRLQKEIDKRNRDAGKSKETSPTDSISNDLACLAISTVDGLYSMRLH